MQPVQGDGGQPVGAVERGRVPGGGAGGLGHGGGVEGDVGPVGDLDERVDAGDALGDVAEVGAGGDGLGQDPGGQGVAAALALGAHPGGQQGAVVADGDLVAVLGGEDLNARAGHEGGAVEDLLDPLGDLLEGLEVLRAHHDGQLGALGDDVGDLAAVGDDGVEAVHGEHLLAQQADAGQGQGGGVQGVAAHEGLGGGVGRHAVEDDAQAAHAQPGLVGDVVGVGVGLDGGVDAVEHAAHGQDLLGGRVLLGGRGLQDDAAGQGAGAGASQGRQGEEGAHGVGAHDVVSAAVADAGQGVVLGEDGDGAGRLAGASGRRIRACGPGDLGAQGGVHAVDADLGLDAVAAQELGDRGHGVVLLVAGLGVVVDVVGELDDLRGQLGDGLPQGGAQGGGGSGVVGQGRCRADDAAALLGLGEHALLDDAGGDGGAGQAVQVARESIVARPPSLREPPPHRGLTFGTRTALSPR